MTRVNCYRCGESLGGTKSYFEYLSVENVCHVEFTCKKCGLVHWAQYVFDPDSLNCEGWTVEVEVWCGEETNDEG